jgi:hypothetical protein
VLDYDFDSYLSKLPHEDLYIKKQESRRETYKNRFHIHGVS